VVQRDYGIGGMDCGMEIRGKCGMMILFLRAYVGRITRETIDSLSLSDFYVISTEREREREEIIRCKSFVDKLREASGKQFELQARV